MAPCRSVVVRVPVRGLWLELGPCSLTGPLDLSVFRQPATHGPPKPHPQRFQPITYGSDQRPALARLARACLRSLARRRACLASNTPRHHRNHTIKTVLNGRPPCIVSLCFGSWPHLIIAPNFSVWRFSGSRYPPVSYQPTSNDRPAKTSNTSNSDK